MMLVGAGRLCFFFAIVQFPLCDLFCVSSVKLKLIYSIAYGCGHSELNSAFCGWIPWILPMLFHGNGALNPRMPTNRSVAIKKHWQNPPAQAESSV